jgi:peptidoglycan/xylan/chitin deacetylase (PgdA/CDA1 family)
MTSQPSIVFLMYHELEIPGRPLCSPEPGYVRYAVSEAEFRQQIQHLKEGGFDDGSETDLLAAAPILREAGFNATSYITAGWLGRPGYLSPAQLRELVHHGFEIGCHSMTHAYLTDLDDSALYRETYDAKSRLEEVIGTPVHHFSCPGGRYNVRVGQAARAAGFRTVATSRIHVNSPHTDVFGLGRVAILRGLEISEFAGICNGEALSRLRAQSGVRLAARRVLGSSLYDRLRKVMLRHDA